MFKALPSHEDLEHRTALRIADPAVRPRFEEETEEGEPGDTANDYRVGTRSRQEMNFRSRRKKAMSLPMWWSFCSVRLIGLFLLMVSVVCIPSVSAEDTWERVLVGGFGDPSRKRAAALALYGDYVYAATTGALPDGSADPKIFRATIRDDHVWSDATPPWTPPLWSAGEVTTMLVFDGHLFVGTAGGRLWRLDAFGVWSNVTSALPGSGPIHSLASWRRDTRRTLLCMGRGNFSLWCNADRDASGLWEELRVPPALWRGDPARNAIGSATLRGFGYELYVGVGGATAGGRTCAVWKYHAERGWSSVTGDCFGREGLTWVPAMAEFRRRLYFGTGGHGDTAVVYRTTGSGLEDVTPCAALYDGCPTFGFSPIRYGSMAVADGWLYVGTRTRSGSFQGADVLATDGATWRFSAREGFGIMGNDTTSALGSRDAYLYAGTDNPPSGFEVWRRVPTVAELFPYMFRDFDIMRKIRADLFRDFDICARRVRVPCPFAVERLLLPLESIRLAFDRAEHPQDDPGLIKAARGLISQAFEHVGEAQQLADLAEKTKDPKEAQRLRLEAMSHVNEAVKITSDAIALAKGSVPKGGSQE